MSNNTIECRIPDINAFFDSTTWLTEQREGVTRFRKSNAITGVVGGIAVIVLGAIAFIYGVADVFGGLTLPMGLWFLIGGPIIVVSGAGMILSGISAGANATQFNPATDLDELCRAAYARSLARKDSDLSEQDRQMLDAYHFYPLPVWQGHSTDDWETRVAKPKPRSGGQPIKCTRCGKTADHSETSVTSLPVSTQYLEAYRDKEPPETQQLIESLYLTYQSCGSTYCYECTGYSENKTERFLCPVCGKATGGSACRGKRWDELRRSRSEKDEAFTVESVSVDRVPRPDGRSFDVTVHLAGNPYGSLTFENVAFSVDGMWFLASPEPVLPK